jgi:signal transduction histidine kinase
MDRGNIFSGSSFRATFYGALVFLCVLTVSGFAAIRFIENQLLSEVRSQFTATIAELRADFRQNGASSFKSNVEDVSRVFSRLNRLAALFDSNGNLVVGRSDIAPDFEGWIVRKIPSHTGADIFEEYYMTAVQIGEYKLVIGHDLQFIRHFETVTIRSFGAVGAFMSLVLILIGYRISRQSQIKLENMDDALDRVARGESGARIAISNDNDQIDRIARIMNGHLDMLSELMRSTKATAASIAHDLKRPLSRSYLGLERALDDEDLSESAREYLEDTRTELASLSAIFETILRIAGIDAAQGTELPERFDLAELAADLGEVYEVVAEESGQRLILEIEDGTPEVIRGDRGMVGQLIVNLLQNAITHCPNGTFITLGVTGTANHVMLTVSDTGPGLPAADRERVFEAFFRADAARSTEGSGLGMALVRSIVDRHTAEISLDDNNPGLRVTVAFKRS